MPEHFTAPHKAMQKQEVGQAGLPRVYLRVILNIVAVKPHFTNSKVYCEVSYSRQDPF